jgi:hypothetical protein
MKAIYLLVLISLALNIASCTRDVDAPVSWKKPDTKSLGCTDYLSLVVDDGVLTNNVWNKGAADQNSWSQCLESREFNGATQYGWSWSWPRNKKVIYSYPQIKRGVSPWAPIPKFDERFPLALSAVEKMIISYDVEIDTNGQHNLATSMWLTDAPHTGTEPNSSIIAAEVMIWTYATKNHFNPAGKKYGSITSNNTEWEVWYDKNWGDASGENSNKWIYLTFRAKESSLKTSFDVIDLLSYAINKNLITSDLFISDVELGNEIMDGEGITWINKFDVDIHPKPQ